MNYKIICAFIMTLCLLLSSCSKGFFAKHDGIYSPAFKDQIMFNGLNISVNKLINSTDISTIVCTISNKSNTVVSFHPHEWSAQDSNHQIMPLLGYYYYEMTMDDAPYFTLITVSSPTFYNPWASTPISGKKKKGDLRFISYSRFRDIDGNRAKSIQFPFQDALRDRTKNIYAFAPLDTGPNLSNFKPASEEALLRSIEIQPDSKVVLVMYAQKTTPAESGVLIKNNDSSLNLPTPGEYFFVDIMEMWDL